MTPDPAQTPHRLLLRGTIREIVVVVASILIAFSLDAWWDSWKERREEAFLIRMLIIEFDQNLEQLDQISSSTRGLLDGLRTVRRFTSQSELTQAQLDSVPALLIGLHGWFTYTPTTSNLDAAVSTGSLGFIQNDALRVELAGWSGALSDSGEQEVWVHTMARGYNRPFLNGRVKLPHQAQELEERPIEASLVPELLSDLEFQNMLTYQMDLLYWDLDEKGRLREKLSLILNLLRQEAGEEQ